MLFCLADLTATSSSLRDEVRHLRGTVSSLDREKDTLQNVVDEKTEKIAGLEHEVVGRGRSLSDTRATVEDLQERLE